MSPNIPSEDIGQNGLAHEIDLHVRVSSPLKSRESHAADPPGREETPQIAGNAWVVRPSSGKGGQDETQDTRLITWAVAAPRYGQPDWPRGTTAQTSYVRPRVLREKCCVNR